MAGGGVISSGASEELKEFAEKLDAPVASTLMGLGAYPASSPRSLGMMGMHGTMSAARTCIAADTIIALGTRFSDRVALNRDKFAENKTVIQIDIEDAEINKNVNANVALMADVKEALKTVNAALPQQNHADWMKECAERKKKRHHRLQRIDHGI